jgi:hypothetical protein
MFCYEDNRGQHPLVARDILIAGARRSRLGLRRLDIWQAALQDELPRRKEPSGGRFPLALARCA